ncbi:hypothetical protein EON65_29110 [archaeon]|nr:MAG: hypothetical protein EON65_29110 [archaeon]
MSKTANDMFVDFEEFQHSKEPSRFQSVSTMVYQEALFFYLDQDLSTTNNSSSYIASKPINGNDDVLSPAKMFSDGNKISPHALITNEGIALHTPIHSLMERNILGKLYTYRFYGKLYIFHSCLYRRGCFSVSKHNVHEGTENG